MLRRYTIVTDRQEKKELIFPTSLVVADPLTRKPRTVCFDFITERLDERHPELPKADYYIRGHPDKVVIERKGCIAEVAQNVLKASRRKRFIAELAYLQDHIKRPILLFEGSPRTLLTPTYHCKQPGIALDCLLDLLMKYRIEMLLLPNSTTAAARAMGEFVARIMLRGVLTL